MVSKKTPSGDVRLDISQGKNVKMMDLKIVKQPNGNFKIFIKGKSSDLFELFQGKIIVNPEKGHNISINYGERGITFTQSNYKKMGETIKANRRYKKEHREEEKYKKILEKIVEILEDLR